MPLVYAITLNWNRPDDTVDCLSTLSAQTYGNLRLLVVDNGSVDDSVALLQDRFPGVEVLASAENRGFAGGANLGLHRALAAGADHVFLLNNDTLVDPQAIAQLVSHVQPDVGILAPVIYYAGDPTRIWSAGGRVRFWLLDKYGDREGDIDVGPWPETVEQDFVTGCGMLLSRSLLESVGLFDERFFMYYEDFDLCLRARRAGFRLLLVPAARMWHQVARSSGGRDTVNERYWMGRSSVILFRKHARGAQWLAIGPWRLASAARTTLRLLRTGQREACAAYWRGLRDGVRAE